MRNSKGESPVDLIHAEIIRKPHNEYIKSQFWTSLCENFDLEGVTVFDDLPEPEVSEGFDAELYDGIMAAESTNPATKTVGKFLKFLQFADTLNSTEFYGALQGTKPRLHVSYKASQQMQVVIYPHHDE